MSKMYINARIDTLYFIIRMYYYVWDEFCKKNRDFHDFLEMFMNNILQTDVDAVFRSKLSSAHQDRNILQRRLTVCVKTLHGWSTT